MTLPGAGETMRAAMEPLKIGITGVRGVVGQTLTPDLVVRFAEAFGAYLDGGRVLVCRDPRPSGPMLQAAVTAGLLSVGCEAVDLGICPTPSLQLEVARSGARGRRSRSRAGTTRPTGTRSSSCAPTAST